MIQRLPRKRPIDYILPFLIIICAGVIVVLGYQLWSSLNTDSNEKDIFMYTAQGSSKILPWGAGEWERGYNGTRLLQGDSIKTLSGGRIVIELFNDHYIRLDEKTELAMTEIKKNGDSYEINLTLLEGRVWLNSNESSKTPVKFTVKTNHTFVKTVGTIYEVEQLAGNEVIRVIKGTILADIMIEDNGKTNKVESLQIGVGQEATLSAEVLQKYANRESPSVVNALSDAFRESGFYKWNMSEDQMPSDFSKAGSTDMLNDNGATPEPETGLPVLEGELASPAITTPSTLNFSTTESSINIRGTTVAETKKMMVDVKSGTTVNTYTLNLYVEGNTEWNFIVSEDAGTMRSGLNEYSFYALGDNEAASGKTKLSVVYNKEGAQEEEEEEPVVTGTLTAPTVNTYNGGASNTVSVDGIKVVGSVSGAEKILVDGYQLKAFTAGDSTWSYTVKESYGNLKAGENVYTVEAYAKDGSKKTATFKIIYNKPAATTTETPATPEPTT